jgi:hypothetical protein
MWHARNKNPFVPAQAGTQGHTERLTYSWLDPRFRGDERGESHPTLIFRCIA